MDLEFLDNYIREQISSNVDICSATVMALKEGKIDKDYALEVLYKAKTSALKSFDQRCALFEANRLDYSNIENEKNAFSDNLDDAVYSIVNPKDHDKIDTRIDELLR